MGCSASARAGNDPLGGSIGRSMTLVLTTDASRGCLNSPNVSQSGAGPTGVNGTPTTGPSGGNSCSAGGGSTSGGGGSHGVMTPVPARSQRRGGPTVLSPTSSQMLPTTPLAAGTQSPKTSPRGFVGEPPPMPQQQQQQAPPPPPSSAHMLHSPRGTAGGNAVGSEDLENDLLHQMVLQFCQHCPVAARSLVRVAPGVYLHGSKKLVLVLRHGRLMVRIGGGFVHLTESLLNSPALASSAGSFVALCGGAGALGAQPGPSSSHPCSNSANAPSTAVGSAAPPFLGTTSGGAAAAASAGGGGGGPTSSNLRGVPKGWTSTAPARVYSSSPVA